MTAPPFDQEAATLAWQRLRFALGAAGLGTWHVDLRTGVATHDENFNLILGLGTIETTGSLDDPSFTHIHPDDRGRVSDAIANAIATHAEYHLEFRVVREDGSLRWLRDRGRVILDNDGTALFATGAVMDVTEQRLAELERARLFRELQQANRVKDEFLATLSHELRTPLNAVLGWTRMLRRGTVPPERTNAVLDTIERNAAAQTQLVEELLDLSAMTSGGLRLAVTRVDLRELVGGAIETVRPAADAKSQRMHLTIDESVGELAGDPGRLRQVLWNLLANAVKFTPPGGAVDVTVTQGPSDVEITVRDTGPGIAPDFLPHVFDPFRQGDSPATRAVGGLGLGLAIVRHIVEAHGGTVSAQSGGDRQGSTFCVRLPSGRPHGSSSSPRGADVLRGRRVLAVDDDESTQELVATMLLMYGVSVRTAGHAAQAMQILSEWRPDVLLTDIAMPGEDGYALMRRVRSMPPPLGTIPAVALTAYTDPQSVQHAFSAGFDAHLGKPLEPHVLADALSKVMRLRHRSG